MAPVLPTLLALDTCTHDDTESSASRSARGLVGTLWNPARAGEGVLLDIEHRGATPTVFLSWFTYGVDGEQRWLVGSGPVDLASGTVTGIELFEAGGADFGDQFDADDVELRRWGQATLQMPTCDQATLSFEGQFAEQSSESGEIELVRFTDGLHDFACR